MTGSCGLIGGEVVEYFGGRGHLVVGLDNNMRREFFGEEGDTLKNLYRVAHVAGKNYYHHQADICDMFNTSLIFKEQGPFDAVIHCAAQPSHDKAREIPDKDFEVNVHGTQIMLEATRRHSSGAVFIFMSTNKVYGDAPNEIPVIEHPTRWDYASDVDMDGVDETCRVDRSNHSIFGAHKLAADVLVQEYARTYGLKAVVQRGGCLTGPGHAGVEAHGFLSYLVKCALSGKTYKVYGYKGKQVRDNIHSYDVLRAMEEIIKTPRPGEVYNIGGGRANSISILEAITKLEAIMGKKIAWEYVDSNRFGDHICYITDLKKIKDHYPGWSVTKGLDRIFDELTGSDFNFRVEQAWKGIAK